MTSLDEELVAAKNANVRAEPTTDARKLTTLPAGANVAVTGRTTHQGATWYRVALAGVGVGYVFGNLLGEAPAAAPAPVQPAVGVYPGRYEPGDTFRDCPDCPEMVVVPAGSFRMGDLQGGGDDDERPVHTVTIARPFAVGKYEVTRGEFAAFVEATGHHTGVSCWVDAGGGEWKDLAGHGWRDPRFSQTDRDPVVCVSWDEAKAYAAWISRKTGKRYRLPSESEWEYAARAGTSAALYWGSDPDRACGYANVADRSAKDQYSGWMIHDCRDGHVNTSPVGSYEANAFGLHDTLGNVWEWVEDCWNGSYAGAPSDGGAWTSGECSRRVLRGGSWNGRPRYVRSALRIRDTTRRWYDIDGFRIARTLN